MHLQKSNLAKKRRQYEEFSHQRAFFEWARLKKVPEGGYLNDYAWMNNNSGAKSSREGAIMKSMGVLAGVPDITLCLPRGNYHGAYFELKRAMNYRLTKEQKPMIDRLNKLNYFARVSNTIDKTIELVEEYLSLNVHAN